MTLLRVHTTITILTLTSYINFQNWKANLYALTEDAHAEILDKAV